MKFSFIVPVYQDYRRVARALDCLCRQTDKSFEVIVVSDGPDETMREQVMKGGTPNCRYFEVPHLGLKGGAHCIDFGITLASEESEFTYILNGDNTITDDFVESMYDPDADILTCMVDMRDMFGIVLSGRSFLRGRIDRANYAVRTSAARIVRYQILKDQDDFEFFHKCWAYMNSFRPVRVVHCDAILAEHW